MTNWANTAREPQRRRAAHCDETDRAMPQRPARALLSKLSDGKCRTVESLDFTDRRWRAHRGQCALQQSSAVSCEPRHCEGLRRWRPQRVLSKQLGQRRTRTCQSLVASPPSVRGRSARHRPLTRTVATRNPLSLSARTFSSSPRTMGGVTIIGSHDAFKKCVASALRSG